MIKDLKLGMRVFDPTSKSKFIYVVDSIKDKGKYKDNYVVLRLERGQWRTTWHLGTVLDDWDEVAE